MIYNDDFMNNDIPDKSVQLVMADPPYFEVKGDFDFIWSSFDDYLEDVERWSIECKRILADNGSMFWFGDRKKIAYTQIILDKYFNLENNIFWQKAEKCQMEMFDTLRSFYCRGYERILFYSNEIEQTGLEEIIHTPDLWKSIKNYFVSEFNKSGMTIKQANEVMGYATTGSNVAGGLFLEKKIEFVFPTEKAWKKLQTTGYFKKPFEELRKEYEELRKEYEELRKEYEELRRPFNNFKKLSDHWFFTNDVNEYNHDTKKPLQMIRTMILSTTKENDTVFIPFGGSGTDVEACIEDNRNYICYEIDKKHFKTIQDREKKCKMQMKLF